MLFRSDCLGNPKQHRPTKKGKESTRRRYNVRRSPAPSESRYHRARGRGGTWEPADARRVQRLLCGPSNAASSPTAQPRVLLGPGDLRQAAREHLRLTRSRGSATASAPRPPSRRRHSKRAEGGTAAREWPLAFPEAARRTALLRGLARISSTRAVDSNARVTQAQPKRKTDYIKPYNVPNEPRAAPTGSHRPSGASAPFGCWAAVFLYCFRISLTAT